MLRGSWGEQAGLRYVQVDPDGKEDQPLPLIVAIHGRGADATDLTGLAGELNPGAYRWVFPQGPRPVPLGPGYVGWAWYELGEQQAASVVESRERLAGFVEATLARVGVDHDRVVVMGFSQGGAMALHVGLSSPVAFAALVVMSGHLPAPETLRPFLAERRARRVLMVHGIYDPILEIHRAHAARALLEEAGLQPEYHEFPMDHQIAPESLATVRTYLDRVLPG